MAAEGAVCLHAVFGSSTPAAGVLGSVNGDTDGHVKFATAAAALRSSGAAWAAVDAAPGDGSAGARGAGSPEAAIGSKTEPHSRVPIGREVEVIRCVAA